MKAAKKPRRVEDKTVFLLLRQGWVALRKRPAEGLLAGLWEFPNVEGALDEAAAGAAVQDWGLTARDWRSRLNAKHIFTHVEWHMTGYVLEVAERDRRSGPGQTRRRLGSGPCPRPLSGTTPGHGRFLEEAAECGCL